MDSELLFKPLVYLPSSCWWIVLRKDETHSVPILCMEKSPEKTLVNSALTEPDDVQTMSPTPCSHSCCPIPPGWFYYSLFSLQLCKLDWLSAVRHGQASQCTTEREWKIWGAWCKQPLTHWESGRDCLLVTFIRSSRKFNIGQILAKLGLVWTQQNFCWEMLQNNHLTQHVPKYPTWAWGF